MATLTPEDLSAAVLDINAEEVKKELLEKYPTKVARKRAKQIVINRVNPDGAVPEIQSNVRTTPGLIGQRGCPPPEAVDEAARVIPKETFFRPFV